MPPSSRTRPESICPAVRASALVSSGTVRSRVWSITSMNFLAPCIPFLHLLSEGKHQQRLRLHLDSQAGLLDIPPDVRRVALGRVREDHDGLIPDPPHSGHRTR